MGLKCYVPAAGASTGRQGHHIQEAEEEKLPAHYGAPTGQAFLLVTQQLSTCETACPFQLRSSWLSDILPMLQLLTGLRITGVNGIRAPEDAVAQTVVAQ